MPKKQAALPINLQKLSQLSEKKIPSSALNSLRAANSMKQMQNANTPKMSLIGTIGSIKTSHALAEEPSEPRITQQDSYPKINRETKINFSPAVTPKISVPFNSQQTSVQQSQKKPLTLFQQR